MGLIVFMLFCEIGIFFLYFMFFLYSYVVKSIVYIFFILFGNGNIYVLLYGLFKFFLIFG